MRRVGIWALLFTHSFDSQVLPWEIQMPCKCELESCKNLIFNFDYLDKYINSSLKIQSGRDVMLGY